MNKLLRQEFDRLGQKNKSKNKPGKLNREQIWILMNYISSLTQQNSKEYNIFPVIKDQKISSNNVMFSTTLGNKELEDQIKKELGNSGENLALPHTSNPFEIR